MGNLEVPKDDSLWQSIATSLYSAVITYVLIIIIAFMRDLARNMSLSSASRPYAAVVRWYYRFSIQYRDTYVFYYVEFVRLATNLIICCLYVLGTFQHDVPRYTSIIYQVFSSIFIFDLFIHILMSESAISYVTSFNVLIDAVSFPSLILTRGKNDYLNFAFLRAIPAFVAFSRLERRMFVHIFSQNRLLVKLCMKTLVLFYTLAASIQLLEIPGDLLPQSFRDSWDEYGQWNFMNSAYFIIVTLTTVGYGDFSPNTVQGRMYALFIIVIGIIVFSSIISELVEQANRDRGSGYFIKNVRTRHVIVTGNPNLNDLVLFITEFFSDSRQSNLSAKVVVLVDEPGWSETEWFQYIARNQFLQTRLQFIKGSARNSNDLARARMDLADSVFILSSPSTGEDPLLQDTRTVMHILAIRNVRNDIPIYAQTLLEESNLQTQVALSTVSSDARAGSSHRSEKDREQIARFCGLFKAVVQTEYRTLPRTYQGAGRRHMESLLSRHEERNNERVNIHDTEDSIGEALRLSQHVCLQEIQMALIAGNIKANGVGTLLSNLYLDVPISKLTKEDPGWLFEYQMGAAASLMYTIIPEELNGATVKDIANDMFHMGIILVAISDPINVHPHPILSTNERLRTGDLAMILSYHERSYVMGGFHLVALRYARRDLKHAPNHNVKNNNNNNNYKNNNNDDRDSENQFGNLDSSHAIATAPISTSTTASRAPINLNDRTTPPFLRATSPPSSRLWVSPTMTHIKVNMSADDLDALAEADELEGDHGNRLLASPTRDLGDPTSSKPAPYIPENLKGHVIIAIEGTAPLENLPLLLRNLWHKDNRRSMKQKKRERIVVIHPSIGDEVRQRFARFERVSLFFVEGSPASRGSWRRAKLNTANAVASIADITQPMHLSDARTIFTLLTLDVSTAIDHDVFICSELVDEKSLEYLREPTHARRSGAALGEPMERPLSVYLDQSPGSLGPSSFRPDLHRDRLAVAAATAGTSTTDVNASGTGTAGTATGTGGNVAGTSGTATSGDGGMSESRAQRNKPRTIKFEADALAFSHHREITEAEAMSPKSTRHVGLQVADTAAGTGNVGGNAAASPGGSGSGIGGSGAAGGRESSTKEQSSRETSVGGSTFARLASKAIPKKAMLGNLTTTGKPGVSGVSADAKSLTLNMGPESANAANLQGGADPSYRPGAARARRSTLFSRSRYASGELLVQSSALTLLAREYIEPGFVTFFTNVLGTDVSSPGMKIRLVRIPKSLFNPSRGYTCRQGRRLIRYNDVVQILIELGVTPLGIYRSGSAPVLIPYKMRRKRGIAITSELEPLLEKMSRESDLKRLRDENRKVIGDKVKHIAKRMKDVNPVKQRENLGREEIHGHVQHLFSLDSSDEDDLDDDDDDEEDDDGPVTSRTPLTPGEGPNLGGIISGAADDDLDLGPQPSAARMGNVMSLSSDGVPSSSHTENETVDEGSGERDIISAERSDAIDEDDAILNKPSAKWGLGFRKGSSHEDEKSGGLLWRPTAGRDGGTPHTRFVYNTDPALAVPGRAKYSERPNAENLLPYVYTLPEPNTWCAENDAIFILCDPSFDLPSKWTETLNETGPNSQDPV